MVLQCNAGEEEAAFFYEKRSPEDRNIFGAFYIIIIFGAFNYFPNSILKVVPLPISVSFMKIFPL